MSWQQRVPQLPYNQYDRTINKLAAIHGIEDLNSFLNPSEKFLNDPYLLKNIETGTKRIVEAIHNGEKIVIMSDIDPDGCTSTAILYHYLNYCSAEVSYIHAQRKDGHGLHTTINIIPDDTDLLIVVDSSSNNWEECRQLNEKGIDVVIIDHHEIEKPNYYCTLINPHQEDCEYPNKNISGSGLVWQVCRVLDYELNINYAYELIDLAAVGLISDTMCMKTMENRAIVNIGLKNIINTGLSEIIRQQNLAYKELSTTDIGFKVTTLLNAAARMNRLELALELLTTEDESRANEIVKEINKLNTKRKGVQLEHYEYLLEQVDLDQKILIYLDHEKEISKSFSGLIAGQIANTYQRPCLILSPDESRGQSYSGSYRSYGDFNLKAFFESIPLVESAGGHAGAGGINVKIYNLDAFIEEVQKRVQDIDFKEGFEYDLEFDASEINEGLIREINEFYRICGRNFPMGKFLVKDIFVIDTKVKGKNRDTIEVESENFNLIKFRSNEKLAEKFPAFSKVSAIGTLSINEWYNFGKRMLVKTNQMILDDFVVH